MNQKDIRHFSSCNHNRFNSLTINMQVIAILLVCLAAANAFVIPATTLVRTPAHDSAIIKSDRLGGNFAYSTVEGHAYAAITPVVQRVLTPVGISQRVIPAAPQLLPFAPVPQYYAPAPIASVVPEQRILVA